MILGIGGFAGLGAIGNIRTESHRAGVLEALSPVEPQFTLADTTGETWTEARLVGQPSVVTFVFTNCPDVCPTTLGEMSTWMQDLGRRANTVNWIAVTLDPDRDTAPAFRDYLDAFDPRIVGLRGVTQAATEEAADSFSVTHRRVELEDSAAGYTLDHSPLVYLIDKQGTFQTFIGPNDNEALARYLLRELLGPDPGSGKRNDTRTSDAPKPSRKRHGTQ